MTDDNTPKLTPEFVRKLLQQPENRELIRRRLSNLSEPAKAERPSAEPTP